MKSAGIRERPHISSDLVEGSNVSHRTSPNERNHINWGILTAETIKMESTCDLKSK